MYYTTLYYTAKSHRVSRKALDCNKGAKGAVHIPQMSRTTACWELRVLGNLEYCPTPCYTILDKAMLHTTPL